MKTNAFTSWLTKKSKGNKLVDIIWNAAGSGLSAIQAAVLLIFIAARYDLKTSGIVTIGYAIANLFLTVARFGVRNYQVTDRSEQGIFPDYLYARVITVGASLLAAVLFLLFKSVSGSYEIGKSLVILEITALKLVDAYGDVYFGRYQQLDRFLSAAKILTIQQFLVTALICLLIALRLPIAFAFAVGIVFSALLLAFLIRMSVREIDKPSAFSFRREEVFSLLRKCLPLCVGTSLAIYVGNIPKYAIDSMLGEDKQAIFGYLMLPVFVVTLLNQFIYLPFVKDLGDLWAEGKTAQFRRRILMQCGIVAGLSLAVLIVGYTIGLPILSWMYRVELRGFGKEFLILLLGGSLYSLAFYLTVPITTVRRQKSIALGYIVAAAFSLAAQRSFITRFDMRGAAWLYVFANLILVLGYGAVLAAEIRKAVRSEGETRS